MSEYVALRLPLPGVVVTWFVTYCRSRRGFLLAKVVTCQASNVSTKSTHSYGDTRSYLSAASDE